MKRLAVAMTAFVMLIMPVAAEARSHHYRPHYKPHKGHYHHYHHRHRHHGNPFPWIVGGIIGGALGVGIMEFGLPMVDEFFSGSPPRKPAAPKVKKTPVKVEEPTLPPPSPRVCTKKTVGIDEKNQPIEQEVCTGG